MPIGNKNPAGVFGAANDHLAEIKAHLALQTTCLEKIAKFPDIQDEAQQYHWLRGSGVADGSGNGQVILTNQMGAALELVSFFCACPGTAATGGGVVFLLNAGTSQQSGQFEPQNGIWAAPQTQYNSDKFHSGMVVPVNQSVVVQFLSVGANQPIFANIYTLLYFMRNRRPYNARPSGW
jgi:hypothetical protein